jgi:lipopolysaccharide/colanic/teichoic acid biosynthesis glycosyltransferase
MKKRIFDVTVSLVGLVVLTPLLISIGIIIRLSDKGPAFFPQKRVGKGGKLFSMYKFRSMVFSESAKDGLFEPGNTSRITQVGKYLRRTKLDELPQLINVLKGEMSIVGPRPEVMKWVAVYPDRWERVLKVKPGITDEASLVFNDEESVLSESDDPELMYREVILPRKLDLYEEYARNNSLQGDIRLILKTIFCVVWKTNSKREGSLVKNYL